MTNGFEKISKVWTEFPMEFKNSTLYGDVNTLKTAFEEKKNFFGDYLTRIVIIGKVSAGKSALINALLGKQYFESVAGNGTVAFFYCSLSEKNYEYFTVDDCQIEYKDIESLKNSSRLNNHLPDYFDQNSVIKVYVKHDESKILERKTVIVDCPGFEHDENYDKEIEKHCLNADIFIFLFRFNEPATLNQRDLIKKLRDNDKKPTCFYVYNQCDLPEFNENLKITLHNNFIELFGDQYAKNQLLDNNLLYFISAKEADKYDDYARLIKDIKVHQDLYRHRHAQVQAQLSKKKKIFGDKLRHFEYNEREKLSSMKRINEMEGQILDYVKRHIECCRNNLLLDRIFDKMISEIYDCDENCDKNTAPIMICKIEETIKNLVIEFLENHLKESCIDQINGKIQTIINDTNEIIPFNNIELRISKDHLVIPPYRHIKDVFRWFEFGDKTKKAKKSFIKFIQSKASITQINESIKNLYNNEFSKILMYIEDFLDNSSTTNIKSFEDKLGILFNYGNDVDKYNEEYISFYQELHTINT